MSGIREQLFIVVLLYIENMNKINIKKLDIIICYSG